MSDERQEKFYVLLVQLQFKFLVSVFIAIICLHLGNILMNMPYPYNISGSILYYGVYLVGLYALTIFQKHKDIIDNPQLYIPNPNPKSYNPLLWEINYTDVLTDKQLELIMRWARGETWRTLDVHPVMLNRLLRKYVRETLKRKQPGKGGVGKSLEVIEGGGALGDPDPR
jgi:hypothetical protein